MWLLGKVFDISGDKVSAIVTFLKYYFVEGDIFHISLRCSMTKRLQKTILSKLRLSKQRNAITGFVDYLIEI